MEILELGKWLTSQSDRVLFIAAILGATYFMNRVVKRHEATIDTLKTDNRASREMHNQRMIEMTDKVFENSDRVANALTENAAAFRSVEVVMAKVKDKL